jgi:hypothetical protein
MVSTPEFGRPQVKYPAQKQDILNKTFLFSSINRDKFWDNILKQATATSFYTPLNLPFTIILSLDAKQSIQLKMRIKLDSRNQTL